MAGQLALLPTLPAQLHTPRVERLYLRPSAALHLRLQQPRSQQPQRAARRFQGRTAAAPRAEAAAVAEQPAVQEETKQSASTNGTNGSAARAAEPREGIDWDSLGFGLQHACKTQFLATCDGADGEWKGELQPYGPISLMPSAQTLNYGQSVFEGMKALRTAEGRIVIFRPEMNAARMASGAAKMLMPAPPQEMFIRAVQEVVRSNQELVPPAGKGALYLRPLLLGTGPLLGLGPAPSYTFVVYGAAVGAYFKGGQLDPINLLVEESFHRAAPGGNGAVKAAGNYSPVLRLQAAAKAAGFSDVVYLDAVHDRYLEEVSSCNIFTVSGKTIRTPALKGTILPGVTRSAIIELARSKGYTVEEGDVDITDALQADEVFTCGTAVVVCSVGSITYKGQRRQYGTENEPGKVTLELYEALTAIQQMQIPDPFGWVHPVV
eukprot:CAMPEP_0206139414 /NCGR_PEP_ID=MMETSP1473-20131121/5915_1 /ASSEMBLY_ACC=CAM_ASM_001109 /TAXON_ID=1461547 /ORGANISM="Stichococcus sp, Strain RCC1054" /LENGTH=434 /DNA_ID=CAMNT_0053533199 /DNA_START=157 /DNA_END=1461 /DNA_ORIENTATION=+